jgi:hypothetical protein
MTSIVIEKTPSSAHWYTQNGDPAYTVLSKAGTERPTTLADARKLGLVPSVTTIMQSASKPALEAWKQQQMLLAALTLPRMPEESEQSFVDRIISDSKETARFAANRGTMIHAAIEKSFKGEEHEYPATVQSFHLSLEKHFGKQEWVAEASFKSPLGYGGKIDLNASGIVVDAKTKEFGHDDKVVAYDEHCMQLAAYRMGLNMPHARCANVFVSVTHPSLIFIKEWTEEELMRGWNMFFSLLQFWKFKNKYML